MAVVERLIWDKMAILEQQTSDTMRVGQTGQLLNSIHWNFHSPIVMMISKSILQVILTSVMISHSPRQIQRPTRTSATIAQQKMANWTRMLLSPPPEDVED